MRFYLIPSFLRRGSLFLLSLTQEESFAPAVVLLLRVSFTGHVPSYRVLWFYFLVSFSRLYFSGSSFHLSIQQANDFSFFSTKYHQSSAWWGESERIIHILSLSLSPLLVRRVKMKPILRPSTTKHCTIALFLRLYACLSLSSCPSFSANEQAVRHSLLPLVFYHSLNGKWTFSSRMGSLWCGASEPNCISISSSFFPLLPFAYA